MSTIPKFRFENDTKTNAIYKFRNQNVTHVMKTNEISTIQKLMLKQRKYQRLKSTFKNIMETNNIPTIPKTLIKHIMETHDISTNREIKFKQCENQ